MNNKAANASRGLQYAPHVANFSLGYVMFTYTAVPSFFVSYYHTSLPMIGLLMSMTLVSFVLAQPIASRLIARYSSTRVLIGILVAHAVIAVALDLAPTLRLVFVLRTLWGLVAGLLVSVGATHIARLHSGEMGTLQQGVYGGVLTLGGAVGFLLAPWFVSVGNGFGIHAAGALGAIVAVGLLWQHRDGDQTAPGSDSTQDRTVHNILQNPTVLAAAICYVAIIGSYVTLSTFVTSYFNDLGVVGPLNVAVLVMASVGRALGGPAVSRFSLTDERLIRITTAVAAVAFLALLVQSRMTAVVFPLVAMGAVSLPFGAVYNLAADATPYEGVAIAFVIGTGNIASVVLPAVTGIALTATGGYHVTFILLAILNGLAAFSLVLVRGT